MKENIGFWVFVVVFFGFLGLGNAKTLDFDSITSESTIRIDGYGGLAWKNMYVQNGSLEEYSGTGYDYGRVSGNYVAFNGPSLGGMPEISVINGNSFDFFGAFFTAAVNGDEIYIDFTSYREEGGELIQDREDTVITKNGIKSLFEWEDEFVSINRLDIFAYTIEDEIKVKKTFVMDDFKYSINPVPEPGTLLLVGIGFIVLSGMIRKRFKTTEIKSNVF